MIQPDEISSIIKERIENYELQTEEIAIATQKGWTVA